MKIKNVLIIAIVIVIFAALCYAGITEGWRIFGFDRVTSSSEIAVVDISFEDNFVRLKGLTLSSAEKYKGYVYEFKDGNLYVGIKYSLFGKGNDTFDIKIDTKGQEINYIFLKSKGQESFIWPSSKQDEYFNEMTKDLENDIKDHDPAYVEFDTYEVITQKKLED